MSRANLGACDACGATVRWVQVIPTRLRHGTTRKRIPLEPVFDPATSAVPASHALNLGKTRCHPITGDFPLEGHETPALTHFATCPARRPASTATEGT